MKREDVIKFIRKPNVLQQIIKLTSKNLIANVLRNFSFYMSFIMAMAIITICLFWPTTAYEVIIGDDDKLIQEQTFKAKPLTNYTLMSGVLQDSFSNQSSIEKAKALATANGDFSEYCGSEILCERQILNRAMPLANNDIYLINKKNVFYGVYQRSKSTADTNLLLRIPFHHTYNIKNLITVLMPFKMYLDKFVMNAYNLNSSNIVYGIKHGSATQDKNRVDTNPLTQFSAGVIGAHAFLGLTVMVIHMSSSMVFDKEMDIRSLMSIMGMRRIPYILSYVLIYIVVIIVLSFYGALIIVIEPRLINKTIRTFKTYSLIFINYTVVGLLILAQGLLLTTFTRSVRIITFIVLLVQCLQMIVGMTVLKFHLEESRKTADTKTNINWINYIFPVIAFFSTQIELSTEISVTGQIPSPGAKISFLLIMTLITFLVAIYLDFVIDTGTGHTFPWYFPFSWIKRLLSNPNKDRAAAYNVKEERDHLSGYFIEPVNDSLVRVRLLDIEKRFVRTVCCNVTEVRAVQNLTIDLQEGMITAILGHNGAGKTTTFSMLVGLIHSTAGSMNIYGLNPDDPWDKNILNQMMSICMQRDILISNMTCLEHMYLFGVIKGLTENEISIEAYQLFKVLEMLKEKDKKVKILSGGQLRKLCVAIALLGNPKIVILDEPTSGVDPISRRSIWNALKTYKNNRVLILSTHYMDEADILADWKAIMVKGQVVCYGTSMFLKRKFNLGYVLNCTLKSDQPDTVDLLKMIKDNAPSSEFQKRYGMEVTFKIFDQEIVNLCQYMSSEKGMSNLKGLGVMDYGISVTKLEEIFLKLGEVEVDDPENQNENLDNVLEENLVQLIKLSSKTSHNEESNLKFISKSTYTNKENKFLIGFYQFSTLIRLNILLTLRSPVFAILRTVGPVFAISLSALLFWFESSRALNFEATGLNLSMISMPWPPYIIYNFKDPSDLESIKTFSRDLLCIKRMYGPRIVITNRSHIFYNLQGSTHVFITSWNSYNGYKLDFLFIDSFKEGLYGMFLFQMLLQNCLINRLLNVDLSNEIRYYIIADTWNIKWVDCAHPSFMMLSAFVYLMALSVAFNLMNPVISGDVVRDRILGNLSQMTLYGLKYISYWASHFVLHFLHYTAILCVMIIFMCFVSNYLFCELAYGFTFFIIYSFSAIDTILAIYCISTSFNDIVAAEISMSFSIMIPMFLMSVLVFCPLDIMNIMHITFVTLFPFLDPWITVMLIDFKTRQQRHFLYDSFNVEYYMNMSQLLMFKPVRNSLIIHTLHIILYGASFFVYNWYTYTFKRYAQSKTLLQLLRRLKSNDRTSNSISATMEGFAKGANDDLMQNKGLVEEIMAGEVDDGNISAAVGDLTKIFYTVKHFIPRKIETTIALSNVNLVINKGEVFGLLGPSGAGKTTAMSCISQLLMPTSGNIIIYDQINSKFISAADALSKNLIGLCPQNNPIWPNLTVREHLLLYAALRSIPRKSRNSHSLNLIKLVHLKKYAHSLAESLSGGCKRRLSMAISFTGHPDLILLDEPSCGVDPKSRRNLWDTISSAIHNTDKGAVITSQFMEECEALCNRLGIIVNGRIMCIGSPQELKSKFGRGISVDIKIIPGEDDDATFRIKSDLTQYLLELYPRLLTIENFGERLTYRIPKSPDITFGSVFKVIHEAKTKFEIEDYAVSQPTLEQVYFDFAKYQTRDDLRYDVQVHMK